MTTIYTQLPLYEDSVYQYTISLEEQERNLRFYWNERDAAWYMDIKNVDGTVVYLGVKLVADYPMIMDYFSPYMTGTFVLSSENAKQATRISEDSSIVPQFFTLYHIYNNGV